FKVSASGTAPLQYQWQRNGVNIPNANAATYTLTTMSSDNGATFRAVVSNSAGSATSNSATLTVLTNIAPTGTITSPADGTLYRGILTVRDSSGLTQTSSVDVRPRTSVVRIEGNLASAQLTLDGAPITAPFSFTGVEGIVRTLGVVTPQTSGGTTYDFASWSD